MLHDSLDAFVEQDVALRAAVLGATTRRTRCATRIFRVLLTHMMARPGHDRARAGADPHQPQPRAHRRPRDQHRRGRDLRRRRAGTSATERSRDSTVRKRVQAGRPRNQVRLRRNCSDISVKYLSRDLLRFSGSGRSVRAGGDLVAFRLIPREERFFDDFVALAEQIRTGAGTARRDARARSADLGQGRRDQGSRAQVRLHHPRDHPAPAPHLRHPARSRRHPHPGPHARRRDGRDRRVGGDRPALPDRARAAGRARAGAASSRMSCRTGRDRHEGARAAPRRRRAGGRDQPPRERSGSGAPERRSPPLRGGAAIRSSIIKWKEILDFLEAATDRCEDVANVLEGVVVKHA